MSLRERTPFGTLALVVLLGGSGWACQSSASETPGSPDAICPRCTPRAGGESSDFGGSRTAPCPFVERTVEVDAAEAEALGFDVPRLQQLVERGFDLPLRWQALETEWGDAAEGYSENTRIQGKVEIRSYEHTRPDPEFCDGTTCRTDEPRYEQFAQSMCTDWLVMRLDLELATLDGAIEVRGQGTAAEFRPAFRDPTRDGIAGNARLDLSAIEGGLRLQPEGPEPYAGVLQISFDFESDATHGVLWPEVQFTVRDEPGPDGGGVAGSTMTVIYKPVQANW